MNRPYDSRSLSRREFVRLAGLGGAGLIAGCAAPRRGAPEVLLAGLQIKLGAVFPLTGRWTDFARKNQVALDMAVEQLNEASGVGGVRVHVTMRDDASDPARAAELVRELATTDQVLAILGPFSSSEAEVAFPMANTVQVATIAQASSKPGIGRLNRPWAFRSHVDEGRQAVVAVQKWVERYQIKSAVIVYDVLDAVSEDLGTNVFPAAARQNGVQIVDAGGSLAFHTNDLDYGEIVQRLRGLSFDGIMFGGVHPDAARFLPTVRRAGLQQPMVAGSPVFNDSFLRYGGAVVDGTIVPTTFYSGLPARQVQDWVTRFRDRARDALAPVIDPDFGDVNVYNTVHLLAHLILQMGVTNRPEDLAADRERLRRGLAATKDWPGIDGPMGFNDDGDGLRPIYVLMAQGGQWVRLD
jgi:branched-chain amino acid transport system substrate-binding protein